MKKGISLIVLVITIIVMIIIAGAIILSLSSSNVTGKANWARVSSDRANLQAEFAVILADYLATADEDESTGVKFTFTGLKGDANSDYTKWTQRVTAAGLSVSEPTNDDPAGVSVVYTGTAIEGAPSVHPAWYQPGTASGSN